jgi:hypothetical protein
MVEHRACSQHMDVGCFYMTLLHPGCPVAAAAAAAAAAANDPPAATYVETRTDVQCLHRWQKVLNPDLIKGGWAPEVRPWTATATATAAAGAGHLVVSFPHLPGANPGPPACPQLHAALHERQRVLDGCPEGVLDRLAASCFTKCCLLSAAAPRVWIHNPTKCMASHLPGLQEDARILELVAQHGPSRWSFIASHLPGRIGKQCRERWVALLPCTPSHLCMWFACWGQWAPLRAADAPQGSGVVAPGARLVPCCMCNQQRHTWVQRLAAGDSGVVAPCPLLVLC